MDSMRRLSPPLWRLSSIKVDCFISVYLKCLLILIISSLFIVGDLFDSRTVQSDESVSLEGSTMKPRLNLTDLDVAGILLS